MSSASEKKHGLAALIILIYFLLAFYRAGCPYAPSTSWESTQKADAIFLDFGEPKELGSLAIYLGNYENRRLSIQIGNPVRSSDLVEPGNFVETGNSAEPGRDLRIQWESLPDVSIKRVYQWNNIRLNQKAQYLRLTTLNQFTQFNEFIFQTPQGEEIQPQNKARYPWLFDESWMYPGYASFLTGTVFDESVFARTAYEYLHGLRSYEDTHPPMGKLLVGAGIACLGMNPLGWRAAGILAGTALLAVVWLFACRLFSDGRISIAVLLLLALDFLHFAESRLGQVDSFLVLFMTAMNYFVFRYYEVMVEGKGRKSWRWLFASGFCMGVAASCKWSGLYGGLGLGAIWTAIIISQYRKRQISRKEIRNTCAVCCLAFILIPVGIYLLSYLPYVAFDRDMGFWERVFQNQINMFDYHTHVGSRHELASRWYQWPVSAKPVKLYLMRFTGKKAELLVLMGNPAFWWTGLVLVFVCLYQMTEKVNGRMAFLLASYFAPVLPWLGIHRYSFLYHYYPSLPFLALLMGLWAEGRGKRGRCCLFACAAVSAVLFLLFYPIISCTRVSQTYIQWLEWLPGWNFVS